ncbi:ATP-binding protein [Ralstonia pseudosolanacearum]|uniref:ATP-binding protein n=1 Tax=Ralstonia pseudosolanacearum TaxID=1310165 RepID=UPI00200622BC|nr:sensor histidine kinase [Ralstonia pseudosolanacearum]MCK4153490.1 sensor histidine kinase [Ralstonia pseudosolanacearum]
MATSKKQKGAGQPKVAASLDSGSIPFDVEVRLLQELGERLVASADVALLELVKNSSDAEASCCKLTLTQHRGVPALVVTDDGNGMSVSDFRERWMRIATSSQREPRTPRYQRSVTGQKGIGRFAIRFLGGALKLRSVCDTPQGRTVLEAVFDWRRLDRAVMLTKARVPFRVTKAKPEDKLGTTLTVWRLKHDLLAAVDKQLLTQVLKIATPESAFDPGPFKRLRANGAKSDPGYRVLFEGFPALSAEDTDVARGVIEHAWARLTVSLVKQTLRYTVRFAGDDNVHELKLRFPNHIKSGLHADIAFTPKRKDAFLGIPMLRNRIWDWLKDNSGIGIVDNGFRIRPYGFTDDDWLFLNQDGSHNRRDWRSDIARLNFPISDLQRARPKLNPALNLPAGLQVIGAVFVSSRASDDPDETDLIPAMDRQGYLVNDAYEEMVEVVRGGLEMLASLDKQRQLEAEERAAEQARRALRSDLAKAADSFRNDPRLAPEERAALVQHYSHLATRLTEQDTYDRNARQRLEIAAGLGVVAGFMTHEAERLFLALDDVIEEIKVHAKRFPELTASIDRIRNSREQLDSYISYTRLFTDSLRGDDTKPFSALGQIEWVVDHFHKIPESRGISTDVACEEDVMVPPIPVAMYSAVLLNLYSNATKAILARESDELEPVILISAWNDARFHHLTVQDTGNGIAEDMRERIWDPFFTTTSRTNSPLGTGMGLGLPLVRDLVSRANGKAIVDQPSPGFVTCIHIQIPRRPNAG